MTLYRYRYVIGYALLSILTVGLLALNFNILPPGLSEGEKTSALASSSVDLTFRIETLGQDILHFLQTTNVVNLPYHLLQKASLEIFGLSPLGVRLPSLIIAGVSAFMLFVLFRRLLLPSAAGVTAVFVATSSWFLSVGHLGTPDVMVMFWGSLIILLATLVSQESRHSHTWKALGLLAVALSLYTPYTAYLFVAVAVATFTQPHLRYVIRYSEKASITLGILLSLIILTPLAFHIWRDPSVVWQLLAIPSLPDPISFLREFVVALSNLINPFNIAFERNPLPLITIPTTIFALIGLVQLIKEWHSVRSHVLLVWFAVLVPLIGLDTSHNLVVLFVPVMLLCAIGMQSLFKYWYTIFPRNPYARVFGLLPLGLLVITLIQFNYQRYFLAVPFAASTPALYDPDAFILNKTLSSKAHRDQRILLIAPQDKVNLYKIDQTIAKDLVVIPVGEFRATNNATRVIVAESEIAKLTRAQVLLLPKGKTELLVNDRKEDGLRFRIYSTP